MLIGEEWWRPLPPGLPRDISRLLAARALRAFADGMMAVLLPLHLHARGFSPLAIGALLTATLVGSALATLAVGWLSRHGTRRGWLALGCALMAATGIGFAVAQDYALLLAVAFLGTLNPSSGDVSLFLPLEHTALAQAAPPARRTAVFARYSLAGTLAGALGTLAAPVPHALGGDGAMFWVFLFYALVALGAWGLYRGLTPAIETPATSGPPAALGPSRRIVYGLSALFALDSLGSGFFVQSLLALWLFDTFDLSLAATAAILFWSGLCSAVSYLVAVPLAARIGLVNTMVFTHLPASLMVMALPFAPSLEVAVALLLARAALSNMDVPTRNSYVMAVVTPAERPAAASMTATAKSMATAIGPLLAGWLMTASAFAWPLLIGGAMKAAYDLLLLWRFQRVKPPEEG
jgi:MFS family permease